MAVDPSLIEVVRDGVAADPTNVAVRLHLASLLHDDGQFDEALEHVNAALRHDPRNSEALDLAERCSHELGYAAAAAAFRERANESARAPSAPVAKGPVGRRSEWHFRLVVAAIVFAAIVIAAMIDGNSGPKVFDRDPTTTSTRPSEAF